MKTAQTKKSAKALFATTLFSASLLFTAALSTTHASTESEFIYRPTDMHKKTAIHGQKIDINDNSIGIEYATQKGTYSTNYFLIKVLEYSEETLRSEYMLYLANTPVNQRSADDFFHSYYRTHANQIRMIDKRGYSGTVDDIIKSKDIYHYGNSYTVNKLLVEDQIVLAKQHKTYIEALLDYINHDGEPSRLETLNRLKPATVSK